VNSTRHSKHGFDWAQGQERLDAEGEFKTGALEFCKPLFWQVARIKKGDQILATL
jgi:hypothetical protein